MAEPVRVQTGWDDLGKLILRLAVAGLIILHGIFKLKGGIGWMANVLTAHNLPVFVGYGVYVAEVIAPIFLILGVFTRLAALTIAFDMIMAMFLVLKGKAFELNPRSGALGAEVEMFFLLTALAVFFLGSGAIAMSRGRGRWD